MRITPGTGFALFCIAATAACTSSTSGPAPGSTQVPVPSVRPAAGPPKAHITRPFPDFGYLPQPKDYTGPVFQLSQQYPATKPTTLPPFLKTDFKQDWKRYINEVRDYCLDGNVDADWRVENNQVRHWYHMPFQHWGTSAREGVHGMTKEAGVRPRQLAPTQSYQDGQAYAVAIYNDLAGYAIGQVWNRDNPTEQFPGATFPEGATVCKPLFVDLGDTNTLSAQVPSLINPLLWDAYITKTYTSQVRSLSKVALIQMDIMVRDERSPVGWVLGTFVYNGQLNETNRWHNLVPLGLMWGNDEAVTGNEYTNPEPKVTRINHTLKETVINDGPELPPTHLGWNGRLNGPLDHSQSSCISCHMTAEYPQVSALSPLFDPALMRRYTDDPATKVYNAKNVGDADWMKWFRNPKVGTAFDASDPQDPSRVPRTTDFVLQLSMTLQAFEDWQYQDGEFAIDWLKHQPPSSAAGALPAGEPFLKHHAMKVTRDVPGPVKK